ncbi:hypothetical protein [Micromonospora sp. NPDC047074]|uniref:hypothetical protein n=1 Tax=Micromonospora sp. NPDC047074 TaxID=3154339 RepID=UPI0033E04466
MSHYLTRPVAGARRSAAVTLAVLGPIVFTAGCGNGDDAAPQSTVTPSQATTTPPAGAPGSPSPSSSSSSTVTIPASAFIELPANRQQAPRNSNQVTDALPKLCGNEFGTGGRSVTAAAAMAYPYVPADAPEGSAPDGVLKQTIFTFSSEGATDYLGRLRTSLESCPSYKRGADVVKVKVEQLPGVGTDALLVVRTWPERNLPGELTGDTATSQTVVIRVDTVITVLDNEGWEGTSANRAAMDDFTRLAVHAIDAWQR